MTITFERPIGSHLDVNELQYLSALHQTGLELRQDATVTGECFVILSFFSFVGSYLKLFILSS